MFESKIKFMFFALFLSLSAGCTIPPGKIEVVELPDGKVDAAPGFLYRAVVAGVFYLEKPTGIHGRSHETAEKLAVEMAENHDNNPIMRSINSGVSHVFGGVDYRERYYDRWFFEDSYSDLLPFISVPVNLISDGDLVEMIVEPVRINWLWKFAIRAAPVNEPWDNVRSIRGIVLRVVCKATDDECFEREYRNYPCDNGAMVIDGERRPERKCGGYGPISDEYAHVIGPVDEIYGSLDNYLKFHNIPWDKECLTMTFDCDRENGNTIPYQGYNEWLETRPNYIPAQELATELYEDEGDWDDEDKAFLEYLSSQMLSPEKAMSKKEFLRTYSQ